MWINLVQLEFKMALVNKFQLIFIVMIIISASIGEVIAIVSLGPVLNALSGIQTDNLFNKLTTTFFEISDDEEITFFMLLFILANALNIILQTIKLFSIRSFATTYASNLDKAFLNAILNSDTHTKAKLRKSELLSLISVKIDEVILRTLMPKLNIINNVLVISFTVTFLIFLNINFTIYFVSFTIIFYAINIVIFNSRIKSFGNQQSELRVQLIQLAEDITDNWKQILNFSVQNFLKEPFHRLSQKLRYAQNSISLYASLPRYLLEFILIGFLGLLFVLLDLKNDVEKLTLLAFFIFAAARLLPQAQQLFGNLTVIKGNKKILSDVELVVSYSYQEPKFQEIDKIQAHAPKYLEFKPWTNHNNKRLQAIPNVMQLSPGELIVITGESGIGKTSFFESMLGFGEVREEAISVQYSSVFMNEIIYYTPQTARIFSLTLYENISFCLDQEVDEEKLSLALYVSGLTELINANVIDPVKKLTSGGVELSGGQRQRILIARSVYHAQGVILLDETFSALDNKSIRKILSRYKENLKLPLIVISHDRTILDFATQEIRIQEENA